MMAILKTRCGATQMVEMTDPHAEYGHDWRVAMPAPIKPWAEIMTLPDCNDGIEFRTFRSVGFDVLIGIGRVALYEERA